MFLINRLEIIKIVAGKQPRLFSFHRPAADHGRGHIRAGRAKSVAGKHAEQSGAGES